MFTFRTTTINFFVFLFLLNILALTGSVIPFWYYLVLIGIYLSISVTFSFFIRSNYHMKAFSRGETQEKNIAITFDDGPDIEYTRRVLDILNSAGVKATFFCIGRKIQGNEELLRKMYNDGHLIGTHSYSHSNWFDFYSPRRMKREFELCEEKLVEITGKRPLLFRPPYGVINPMVKRALRSTGYHVIGFSNRAWDTTAGNEKKILSRITRQLKPGDILLLHDTVQQNINVLIRFLDHLKEKGYRVVPLDSLLKIEAYATE